MTAMAFAPGALSWADPLDYVQGRLSRYNVPNLAMLDMHLRTLIGRRAQALASPNLTPFGRAKLALDIRHDLDALLDRRMWLMLTEA